MIVKELKKLELQIDNFIESHGLLVLENSSLRKKIHQLTKERSLLLDKNKKAADTVKKIVSQLKDELTCRSQK